MSKEENYAVGYGQPPKHAQFPKGTSGYPQGRRRGARNAKTILRQELNAPIRVREGDKVRKITKLEAVFKKLLEKALQGDVRAMSKLFDLLQRYPEFFDGLPEAKSAAADDDKIMEHFLERMLRQQRLGRVSPAPDDDSVKDSKPADSRSNQADPAKNMKKKEKKDE